MRAMANRAKAGSGWFIEPAPHSVHFHLIGPAKTIPDISIIRASYCTKEDATLFASAERMRTALRAIAAAAHEPWYLSLWRGGKRHVRAAQAVLETAGR